MSLISTDQLTALITALPERRFAQLCNDTLALIAAAGGISRAHFDLTLNTAEPEGGLDAVSHGVPVAVGRLVPAGNAGYQYKSGTASKSAARIAREDIAEKARVRGLLEAGGTFVYIAGWDRASKVETAVRRAARGLGIDIKESQFVFFTAHSLAQVLQAHPAIVMRHFGVEANLLTLDQWSAIPALTNPYVVDDALVGQMEALRTIVTVGPGPVRLVGAPGDGKTRLVLESLRTSPVAHSVVYSSQREHVTANLVGYLRSTPDVECTLVVDEVDEAGADDLGRLFASMPPGVRLLTIGQDAGPPQFGTLRVEGLREDLLVEAIQAIAQGLDPTVAREIARACQHSPKLAVLIARRIAEQPELAVPHRLLADGNVQRTLDRYLGIDPADPSWEVLSCFALLQRVGWTDEAGLESEILFRAVGLSPKSARHAVEEVHRRTGVAPRAGRFRYISPAILGDHLAARQLAAWPGTEVGAFLQTLTPAMARSFGLRVRRMAEVLENRKVLGEIVFGAGGPFRTLDDLISTGFASLVPVLAPVFPEETLGCLRRLVDRTSDEELRADVAVRRMLVDTVTDLLWRKDTFEEAAGVLLRLAANENETWGNNATGIWTETFQVQLGRTEAGPKVRLRVLREAARSDNPIERQLVAKALGQACGVGDITRTGRPPADVSGMPNEAWHPKTYNEWFEVLRASYDLLGTLLSDPQPAVCLAAARALRTGSEAAVRFPVTEAWIAAAGNALGSEYEVRSELLAGAQDVLERHSEDLDLDAEEKAEDELNGDNLEARNAVRERLSLLSLFARELRGDDLGTRLRWAIEREYRFGRGVDYESEMRERDESLRRLMEEAVLEPARLIAEWDWLASQSQGSGRWAHALGWTDRNRILADFVLSRAGLDSSGPRWLAEYETGYAQAVDDIGWVDLRLTSLVNQGVAGDVILPLLHRAGASPARVELAIRLFAEQRLGGAALSAFVYTDWTRLDASAVERLVRASTSSSAPTAVTAAVLFLATTLRRKTPWSDSLRLLAADLIRSSPVLGARGRGADDWALVALEVAGLDPSGVAEAVLRQLSDSSVNEEEDLLAVLRNVWEQGDKRTLLWEHLGPAITRPDAAGWTLRNRLERFGFPDVAPAVLRSWIDEDAETRALAVAELAGAPDTNASDLQAMLLEFYDEHGVGGVLFGHLISGVHWGSHSNWLSGRRAMIEPLLTDARPAVSAWAEESVEALDGKIARERKREEEEPMRWL